MTGARPVSPCSMARIQLRLHVTCTSNFLEVIPGISLYNSWLFRRRDVLGMSRGIYKGQGLDSWEQLEWSELGVGE